MQNFNSPTSVIFKQVFKFILSASGPIEDIYATSYYNGYERCWDITGIELYADLSFLSTYNIISLCSETTINPKILINSNQFHKIVGYTFVT